MIPELKKTAESKMQKTLEALKNDLQKVRTGRAHIGLLDHVQVDYYGSMVPVNQVANITLVDARTIAADKLRAFVEGLGLPVLGYVRDTQNYIHLAARGLTVFDVAPGRVEKDLQQWQGICRWLDQ